MIEHSHPSHEEHRRPSRISQVPGAAKSAARRLALVALAAVLGSALGVRLALPARAAEPVAVDEGAADGFSVHYAALGDCRRQVFVAPAEGGPWERVGEIGEGQGLTLRLQGEQGMRVGLAEGEDLHGAISHADRYEAPAGEAARRAVSIRCSD